ncbi:hypothetical protein F8388_004527 [Cannabis sativa]|uniref:Uncharacterized protein n=1 Tax=Cannabis sativa TaxID=3483 RepID=A0A7J6EQU6_CANSA|nr:hypothetical protein F8388_004527 [Cannabis sativa]
MGLNRNKGDPPKKILLLPFFRKKRRIRTKSMKRKRYEFEFEKPLVTILFDSKRWNRPFRYIKNARFKNSFVNLVRNDTKKSVFVHYRETLFQQII